MLNSNEKSETPGEKTLTMVDTKTTILQKFENRRAIFFFRGNVRCRGEQRLSREEKKSRQECTRRSVLSGRVIGRKRQKYALIGRQLG